MAYFVEIVMPRYQRIRKSNAPMIFIDKYINCHTIQGFGALLIQIGEEIHKHRFSFKIL